MIDLSVIGKTIKKQDDKKYYYDLKREEIIIGDTSMHDVLLIEKLNENEFESITERFILSHFDSCLQKKIKTDNRKDFLKMLEELNMCDEFDCFLDDICYLIAYQWAVDHRLIDYDNVFFLKQLVEISDDLFNADLKNFYNIPFLVKAEDKEFVFLLENDNYEKRLCIYDSLNDFKEACILSSFERLNVSESVIASLQNVRYVYYTKEENLDDKYLSWLNKTGFSFGNNYPVFANSDKGQSILLMKQLDEVIYLQYLDIMLRCIFKYKDYELSFSENNIFCFDVKKDIVMKSLPLKFEEKFNFVPRGKMNFQSLKLIDFKAYFKIDCYLCNDNIFNYVLNIKDANNQTLFNCEVLIKDIESFYELENKVFNFFFSFGLPRFFYVDDIISYNYLFLMNNKIKISFNFS